MGAVVDVNDLLPFPADVAIVLRSLGFQSVYDINTMEADRFRLDFDTRLNGCAAAIYAYAQRQVGLLDNQFRQNLIPAVSSVSGDVPVYSAEQVAQLQQRALPRVARYHQPLYQQLFDDKEERCVEPGALQSLDSPVCYLVYLMTLLRGVRGGEALRRLVAQRPDLAQLLLDEASFKRALASSDLAGEILIDTLDAILLALPQSQYGAIKNQVKGTSEAVYRYLATQARYPLTMPFDMAMRRIELALAPAEHVLGDVFSQLELSYRQVDSGSSTGKRNAEKAYSGLSPEQIAVITGPAPDRTAPFTVVFDETGKFQGGITPSLTLAGQWPTTSITAVSLVAGSSQPLVCNTADNSKTAKVTLTWSANDAGGVRLANPAMDGTPDGKSVYWGTSTWYARHDNNQTDQVAITIGVLIIGSGVEAATRDLALSSSRAELEADYGLDVSQATAAPMRVPVPMLCQAAQISREELEAFYAIGNDRPSVSKHMPLNGAVEAGLPGHYGASFLWGGRAIYDAAYPPGTIDANQLLCTSDQLDRLQRLIRLKNHLGLPAGQLDMLLNAALHAELAKDRAASPSWSLSANTLRALGVFLRWRDAYGLDAERGAALLFEIPPYARVGQTSLLDKLLQEDGNWKVDGQALSASDKAMLARAFRISDVTLARLLILLTAKSSSVTRSLSTLSALYRPVLVAQLLGIATDDLLALLQLLGGETAVSTSHTLLTLLFTPSIQDSGCDTLDLLLALDQCVQWCQQNQGTLTEWVTLARPADQGMARDKALRQALKDTLESFNETTLLQAFQADGVDGDAAKKAIGEYKLASLIPTRSVASGEVEKTNQFLESHPTVASYLQARFQAVVSAVANQTGLSQGVAAILTSHHADLLDQTSVSLTPLFISAGVVGRDALDETQLLPLAVGVEGLGFKAADTLSDWCRLLALCDYAQLAQGDSRLSPIALWASGQYVVAEVRKAVGAVIGDTVAAEGLIANGAFITGVARVQRMLSVSEWSGWSVASLKEWLDASTMLAWDKRRPLSLTCGTQSGPAAEALDARLSEIQTGALLAFYKAICRRFTIQYRKLGWSLAYREHAPETVDVASTLLIDPEMTAKVPTTRVAEAIASFQAFIQRIAEGAEAGLELTPDELKRWQTTDSRYAVWAANVQLRWHPEQYVNPAARINKTGLFQQFETRLSQSHLDRDAVEGALREYLSGFEKIVNLDVIGGYQDGVDQASSTMYFLGRSKNAPYEYYCRSWGVDGAGMRVWNEWSRIELPSLTDAIPALASKATVIEAEWKKRFENLDSLLTNDQREKLWLPVQARLVVLNGRLYFVWVEAREVSGHAQTSTSGEVKATTSVKEYQYVVSMIYRRLGGDWSAPIEVYKSVSTLKPDAYPPHLAVFTIPEGTAEFPAEVLNKAVPKGNLLFIGLLGEPFQLPADPDFDSDPQILAWRAAGHQIKNKNTMSQAIAEKVSGTTYLLLDSFLSEITRNALWGEAGTQSRPGVAKWGGALGNTIRGLILNSYRWIVKGGGQDLVNPDEWFYSTGVVTPCMPNSWLLERRYMKNLGSLVFGPEMKVALSVDGAGQTGRDSYEVISRATISADMLAKVPSDRKLIHFLEINGNSRYAAVSSVDDRLSIFLAFDNGASPCVSSIKHGLVLVAKTAANVVLTDGVDDALIETGVLTVARGELQTMTADIRENRLGVQFLLTQKPDARNAQQKETDTQPSVIGINVATPETEIRLLTGVSFKLLTGVTDMNIAGPLKESKDWLAATYCDGANGQRFSPWAYNLAPDAIKSEVKLATRCTKKDINKLTLSGGQSLYDSNGSKVESLAKVTNDSDVVYLVQNVDLHDLSTMSSQPEYKVFSQPTGSDGALSPMRFEFHALSAGESGTPFTVTGVGLTILSKPVLDRYLAKLGGQTLFVKDDWGWLPAEFSMDVTPAPLNRRFNLASADEMYLAVKIDATKIKGSFDNVTKRWTACGVSAVSLLQASGGYVLGLKSTGTAERIALAAASSASTSSAAGFYWADNRIYLDAPNETAGKALLSQYEYFFIVLPWIANDFKTAADNGLLFALANVYTKTVFGKINCNVAPLARCVITSSYEPATVRVGESARLKITVDLSAEPELSDAAQLTIALGDAFQIGSPAIVPAGTTFPAMGAFGGNITLSDLRQRPRVLEFNIPVQVRDVPPESAALLATVTVTDRQSAQRFTIATPKVLPAQHQRMAVVWQWRYGSVADGLTSVDSRKSISTVDLKSAFLLAAFEVCLNDSWYRRGDSITLTLILPTGLEADDAKWTAVKKAYPNIVDLATNWKTMTDGKLTVVKDLKLTDDVQTILVPLKLSAAAETSIQNKQPLFWNAAEAWVSSANGSPMTLMSAFFMQPSTGIKANLSAVCNVPDMKVPLGGAFSDEVRILVLEQDTVIENITLELPKNCQSKNHSATWIDANGIAKILNGQLTNDQFLKFDLSEIKLDKSRLYTLQVPLLAEPLSAIEINEREKVNKDNKTQFKVKFSHETEAVAVKLGSIEVLPIVGTTITVQNLDGTPLIGERLAVGGKYRYQIDVHMSEEDLRKQVGQEADLQVPLVGVVLTITVSDTQEIIKDKISTTLPTLTEAKFNDIKKKYTTFTVKYPMPPGANENGFFVNNNGQCIVYTLAQAGGLNGKMEIPFEVLKEGDCWATVSIKPQGSNMNVAAANFAWLALQPVNRYSASLLSFDSARLPFSDLRFSHNELGDAFSDPVPLQRSIPMGDIKRARWPSDNLIRLNTQFGKELARIAQRDTETVFESATQEHRQAPLASNGEPELLEKDSANLLYFWELFFHAPFLIAHRLNLEGRHEEAQDWLRRLFEPFPMSRGVTKPTDYWRCRLLTAQFRFVPLTETSGPVDPDAVASYQPVYYRKALFFAYVKNLIDKGDGYFRELTRDSVNEARQCYLLAMSLMGSPQLVTEVETWQPCTLTDASTGYARGVVDQPGQMFYIPRSHLSQELWEKLSTRLYNLRNGLTLDGKPLSLPLYDQPLNPAELLAARSAASGKAAALRSKISVPPFRYGVIHAQASNAVDMLVQFGATLLTVLDRQQDLQLQSLLLRQQQEIGQFLVDIQADTVRLSTANRKVMQAAYEAAVKRAEKLQGWIDADVSSDESHALKLRRDASIIGATSGSLRAVASGLDVVPRIFGFANGGGRIGAIADALSQGILVASDIMLGDASHAETREQYRRRKQDWELAKEQADAEINQLKLQLDADTIQAAIYEKQLAQTRVQLRQFDEQAAFMRARFTSEALFQWMIGQVSSLYYQAYDTVSSLCLLAQEAWRYEVGDYDKSRNFFQSGGWNDARRGLLAGEALRLGLLRMQREYLSRAERQLELTHTFSVRRAYDESTGKVDGDWRRTYISKPLTNFDKSKSKSLWREDDFKKALALAIPFSVTENDLAKRYPGHYMRQLVSVSVTLPGLIGPYEDVCVMLVQKSSRFSLKPTGPVFQAMCTGSASDEIMRDVRPSQAIALSSGLDDGGLFVLNFGDDKLLPFEGNGVVGDWELRFFNPYSASQRRFLDSLTDVIVRFHYRAKDGGDAYATLVSETLLTSGAFGFKATKATP
ncbi:Tc toxin subunit A-related protein [Chromobacterium violaceum]|uniref:Salmonella virulence plasmid 28.1kDa A protein n=2 Tax=Chromobacterium violaceum TaxID=536 RepID=A0AAX2M9F5_CHRVL|nr:Tc toxin subunit A [Chromobacterium violaceum]SUX32631.1 Salmonella virulence plasmid 28.1kDa A protein [Chromobacterium violaceum]